MAFQAKLYVEDNGSSTDEACHYSSPTASSVSSLRSSIEAESLNSGASVMEELVEEPDWYIRLSAIKRQRPDMGAPEDVALYGLRVSLGSILEGFGFATITDDSLDILSDVMKRFMFNLSTKGKFYSEHAGRIDTSVSDLNLAFKRMKFCTTEFSNFLTNNMLAPTKPLPKFPVQKQQIRPLYHPQPSERELEARPEYIPAFLQAAHPEWTRDGADYLAVMKPSTSGEKKGTAPDFPLFAATNSHNLGIGKDDRRPPPPLITRTDDSSATGIKSSANIASQKLYNPDYAAQLIKKKNRPLNGLKESRSNTPIGRSHSPYELEERNHSRTDSPSTSRSAEKVKFKPRPPSSASKHAQQESAKNEQSTSFASAIEAGSLTGMPKLEMIETDSKSFDEETDDIETPPRCNEDLINQNILLFQQLKQQQERYEQDKVVKENLKLEKAKKKIEQKEKKREENRLYREKKKLEKEEHKRKLKQSRKEAQQRQIQKKAEAEAQNERDAQQKLALILEAQKVKSVNQPPLKIIEEQKPLKLVITKPKHSSASSAFSPSPVQAPPSICEHTPPPIINSKQELVNEDTRLYYGTSDIADTTHSFNTSFDETPKKKKKKKDKDRDRSPSSHKKHKKDKEHKKKKKEKREKEERERASFNLFDREPKNEAEQKPLTLKIKLGEHAASAGDGSGVEPVKFKFKLVPPEKKEEEKVAPLRLPLIRTPGSSEKKHKQEKTSKFTPEKEEKMRKKEEKKRKEREETEQRQRAEYERIHREHEEKQKREKEAEEKRKREEEAHQREKEQREREEAERRKEKEKARKMEKELAHINATTELLFKQERKEKPTQSPAKVRTQDDDDEEDEKIWICPTCHVAWTEGANMVACDQCNNWFHWHCVGLLIAPQENVPWYCKKCSRKPLKRPFKPSGEIPKKKKKSSEGFSFVK